MYVLYLLSSPLMCSEYMHVFVLGWNICRIVDFISLCVWFQMDMKWFTGYIHVYNIFSVRDCLIDSQAFASRFGNYLFLKDMKYQITRRILQRILILYIQLPLVLAVSYRQKVSHSLRRKAHLVITYVCMYYSLRGMCVIISGWMWQ